MQEMSLDKAAEVVYRKLKSVAGNPASLPETLRPIAVLYTVQAMIDNGGFQYLFESDFPFNPSYATFSDAYRTIGAADIADRLDRAVSLFPFSNPEFDREARNTFMDSLNEASEFFLLGDAVCGDKRVWELMEDYVKQNAEAFAFND